jgi:hypothetical protein
MAICPGVTDTNLVSEGPRRMMREEWGDEVKRDLDNHPRQKWVLVIKDLPLLHSSYTSDSLDTVAVNFYEYSFVSMQKITSDFFVLGYLRTLLQLGRLGRMSRNCVKNSVQ